MNETTNTNQIGNETNQNATESGTGKVDKRIPTDPIERRLYELEKAERAEKNKAKEGKKEEKTEDKKSVEAKKEVVENKKEEAKKEVVKEAKKVVEKATTSEAIRTPQDEEKAVEKRKFKVKINGLEDEVDEEELIRSYQKERAAEKKFEEAAQMRKSFDGLKKRFEEDPISALLDPSLNLKKEDLVDKLGKWVYDHMQYQEMTPEQRKEFDDKQELERRRADEARQKQQQEEQEIQRQAEEFKQEYDRQFSEAMSKINIPKTGRTVARMAQIMKAALDNGFEKTPEQAARQVREEYLKEYKEVLTKYEPQHLAEFLGEDTLQKLRQYDLSKVVNPVQQVKNTSAGVYEMPKEKEVDHGMRRWNAMLDAIERGKD